VELTGIAAAIDAERDTIMRAERRLDEARRTLTEVIASLDGHRSGGADAQALAALAALHEAKAALTGLPETVGAAALLAQPRPL
jgi:hypothetical protein